MLKRYRSAAAGLCALLVTSSVLYAAGNWSTLPGVGQPSFCVSTVTGASNFGGVTGQGQATNGSICAQTVPAGPPAITGNETMPADTNAAGSPATVTLTTGMLAGIGQGALRNLLVGGDFFTNPFQRGTSFASLTPTTAAMTADRFFVYTSGNTVTVAKKTSGADIAAASNILASLQVNRPSGTDVTPICTGQLLPATETQNLLGRNAVLSFYGLNGAGMSGANGAVQVSIAYATAADSATPGTNTDAFAKSTIAGYTAVTALSPNTTGSVASSVATIPLSTTWTRYAVYGAIPATATTVGVKICYTPVGTGGATDFFDLARVQLEATNQVSAGGFSHRPPALERSLALAYSYVLTDTAITTTYGWCQEKVANTSANCTLQFPQQMRGVPSTTVSAAGWSIQQTDATNELCSALAGVASSNTILEGRLLCTAGGTIALGAVSPFLGGATTSTITFSAEP